MNNVHSLLNIILILCMNGLRGLNLKTVAFSVF